MIRLGIAVEGETEIEFVKNMLVPHLHEHSVDARPTMPGGQGGDIRISRLADGMASLTWDFDVVTCFVDFYGFKGKKPAETVDQLERRIDQALAERSPKYPCGDRLWAYVQSHEFEALLYSDVSAFKIFPEASASAMQDLQHAARSFISPEHINDGPSTAPSKRIKQAIPQFQKRLDGPIVASEIGLSAIRSKCPRFDAWVARLEALRHL